MNSKNKDSATVALPFHYVPFPERPAVMDWGARGYLGMPYEGLLRRHAPPCKLQFHYRLIDHCVTAILKNNH